ncbi:MULTISPECIES: bacillithiol system redox-active protein YtxJ [Bacillaceae]|uniref:Bacillithiol system redox-active protein YtxJ n=1 Tax=Evansella alkalicola TaxID=745819 RepID=A0ABS6JRA7_9BACI|nr:MULTISPECIES: bacillithiol system redox-active protein YtxJ [Bacillaceae]MBU9721093.1 bacillithiol system redox-active protein YtxJ [Bacillus alkalicola]
MGIKKLQNESEFQNVIEANAKFFLLKNSTTCPISHEAFKQVENYATDNEEVPVFYLNVQESRPLSNYIAETFEVKHESPQILLFDNGTIGWHDSHWNVTKQTLSQHWT